jgi:putative endonuclease
MLGHYFYVYIMASKSRVLYIGMCNSLRRRVWEHKSASCPGFTHDYRVHRLVYFERFQYVRNAIRREKQLKGWLRKRKIALIEALNPTWEDLAADWFQPSEEQQVLRAQKTRAQDDNI